MKFEPKQPPRTFQVGKLTDIVLKDCGKMALEPGEQVTFTTEQGGEYDVLRKEWGFYATPSLNARLPQFGLRACLVSSPSGRYYIFMLEKGKEDSFWAYMTAEEHSVVSWLDDTEGMKAVAARISAGGQKG
ncbi:MAG: hypothetical protein ABIW76_14980 [Fibrobacteria bacterium]